MSWDIVLGWLSPIGQYFLAPGLTGAFVIWYTSRNARKQEMSGVTFRRKLEIYEDLFTTLHKFYIQMLQVEEVGFSTLKLEQHKKIQKSLDRIDMAKLDAVMRLYTPETVRFALEDWTRKRNMFWLAFDTYNLSSPMTVESLTKGPQLKELEASLKAVGDSLSHLLGQMQLDISVKSRSPWWRPFG
jgi:hypothetical protein